MSDLRALRERVREAMGPSLVLDGEVWCAVNGYEFVQWDGAGCAYRDPAAPKWDTGIKHAPASVIRSYTASIDAAVALVERVLPGAVWTIENHIGLADGAWVRIGDEYIGTGTTTSLAIIAALLAALEARSQP